MIFRMLMIFAFSALFSGGALASSDVLHDGVSSHQPTIIRGAPLRCHYNRPLVINVAQALKEGVNLTVKCAEAAKKTHRHRPVTITNIVVIAPIYNPVYIRHD